MPLPVHNLLKLCDVQVLYPQFFLQLLNYLFFLVKRGLDLLLDDFQLLSLPFFAVVKFSRCFVLYLLYVKLHLANLGVSLFYSLPQLGLKIHSHLFLFLINTVKLVGCLCVSTFELSDLIFLISYFDFHVVNTPLNNSKVFIKHFLLPILRLGSLSQLGDLH